jgi:rod shape-determining protein MreD
VSPGIATSRVWTAASLVPLLSAITAASVDLLPLPDAAPRALSPSLLLGVCYYWTIRRPDFLPSWVLFALGAALDIAGGMPPGLTALGLLLARGLLGSWRRFLLRQGPVLVWFGLAPVLLLVGLVRWGVLSTLVGGMLPVEPVAAEAGLTFALYPGMTWLLGLLERRLPVPHHAARG